MSYYGALLRFLGYVIVTQIVTSYLHSPIRANEASILPSISSSTVKNGEQVTITAFVLSEQPITEACATIRFQGGIFQPKQELNNTVGICPLVCSVSCISADGLFETICEGVWKAQGLQEAEYRVNLEFLTSSGSG